MAELDALKKTRIAGLRASRIRGRPIPKRERSTSPTWWFAWWRRCRCWHAPPDGTARTRRRGAEAITVGRRCSGCLCLHIAWNRSLVVRGVGAGYDAQPMVRYPGGANQPGAANRWKTIAQLIPKFAGILVELEALRRMVDASPVAISLTRCFRLARFNAALNCGEFHGSDAPPYFDHDAIQQRRSGEDLRHSGILAQGITPEAIVSLGSLEAVPEKEEPEHSQDDEARHRASERNPPKVGKGFQKNRGDPRWQQPQASAIRVMQAPDLDRKCWNNATPESKICNS
jgi:hypothetical protein